MKTELAENILTFNDALDRLRSKLIDLSNRNKLLNFKHSKRSSLRIVDELPDFITKSLLEGKEFEIVAIPTPSDDDAKFLKKERKKISEKEIAELRGIDLDFEIPESKLLKEAKHIDNKLQTSMFSIELEKTLSNISGDSRLAIEEKGINMLYLAIGFLEWYEDSISDELRLAPLYLIPIRLEKTGYDYKNECHRYVISYSGEDIFPNFSLKEKLKVEFDIELPDIEDDEGPEQYFQKIKNVIGEKASRWKIRRYATVSLFHFSKILMYNDLSPNNEIITKSELINQIFSESESQEILGEEIFTEEYDIDGAGTPDIPLVYDADSSQYHVLIDARNGKNLVVEGPPGTGKSQTITNLIAASLYEGKTVLFVSEKLAALEVVRNKLDMVGLGDFCLELHSHKTQKKKLLDDLSKRLNKQGYLEAEDLDEDLLVLYEAKNKLNSYVELTKTKHGKTGKSINNILCAAVHYKELVKDHWKIVKNIIINLPEQIDGLFLSKVEDTVKTYIASIEQIENKDCPRNNIWYGVKVANINSYELDNIKNLLSECCLKARTVNEKLSFIETHYSVILSRNNKLLTSYFSASDQLKNIITGNIAWNNLSSLSEEHLKHEVKDFISEHYNIKTQLGFLREISSSDLDLAIATNNKIASLRNNLDEIGIHDSTFGNIKQFLDFLKINKHNLDLLKELTCKVSNTIDKKIPMSLTCLVFCTKLAQILHNMPEYAWAYRNILQDEETEFFVREAYEQGKKLILEKNEIEKKLDFSQIVSVDALKGYTTEMQTAGRFSFFSPRYRKAKKFYKLIFKNRPLPENEKINYCLRAITLKQSLHEFENSERYKSRLKDAFMGIETNFQEYEKFYEWNNEIIFFLSERLLEASKGIAEKLFSYSAKEINAIGDYAKYPIDELINGIASIDFINNKNDLDIENILINKIISFDNFIASCKEFNFVDILSLQDIKNFVDNYKRIFEKNKSLNDNQEILKTLKCNEVGINTDLSLLKDTIVLVDSLSTYPKEFQDLFIKINSHEEFKEVLSNINDLQDIFNQFDSIYKQLCSSLEVEQTKWLHKIDASNLANLFGFLEKCKEKESSLSSWSNYIRAANKCREYGLGCLIDRVEISQFPYEQLYEAYLAYFYYKLSLGILDTHPKLNDFRGTEHDTLREKYATIDEKIINRRGVQIACKITKRNIPIGNGSGRVKEFTELALIKHEINKRARHQPIRELVRRAGKALVALKPCFMMGPYSIPQYLSFNNINFDLVIMDEASQMFPEYAIGALARAKQAIIVGDSNQLPPTSFFCQAQTLNEDEGELFAIESGESILDTAVSAFQLKRRLRWHYRSRHDSLIAFSNKYFYDNDLIVFPCVHRENENLGVKFRHVEEGRCERGSNPLEARVVAKAIIEHFSNSPDLSLGVATTNIVQMELIKDELERELRENTKYRSLIEEYENFNEPFFIKNLENVQGDERDVIFISLAYGKSFDGSFVQNFGPINQEFGWRRLNVLFTRARSKVILFSSMTSKDIKTTATSPRGVVALKDYLDFAETGNLRQPKLTGKNPDSPFEIQVMGKLTQHGFDCEAQIGVAGYFIDIGVYHPEHKGKFILGIECDGATYHSSKSARDRDRLRGQVLRNNGWNIHRIWSTDWFKDPENEINKIVKKLKHIDSL